MLTIDQDNVYGGLRPNNQQIAESAYLLINNKANNNAILQGASGFFSILVTAAADVAALLTIYAPMWREIRELYNLPPIPDGAAVQMITQIIPEVVADLVFDKVLGNVPVVGIYFNAICAKQMTWRLGTLFTVLSSTGSDVTEIETKETMRLIRYLFPQKDMFMFITPNKANFMKLVLASDQVDPEAFNKKIDKALKMFTE